MSVEQRWNIPVVTKKCELIKFDEVYKAIKFDEIYLLTTIAKNFNRGIILKHKKERYESDKEQKNQRQNTAHTAKMIDRLHAQHHSLYFV